MTVFSRTWNAAYEQSPPDNQDISLGATRIREVKADVQERGEVDHSWAGTVDDGMHIKVTFVDPLGAKPTQANDETYLYSKDVSAKAELFFEDEDGDEIQLTDGGGINLEATVNPLSVTSGGTGAITTMLAQQGLILFHGTVNAAGTAKIWLPSGWTFSRSSTGITVITHSLALGTYNVVVSPYGSVTSPLVLSTGANSFTIHSYSLAGALADGGYTFALMGYIL